MSQVQDLVDRQAIADLVHAYANGVREGAAAVCGAMFTEDGVFEVRERNVLDPASPRQLARTEGRAAITEFIAGGITAPVRVCPLIHNLVIALDGDGASAVCAMEGRTMPPGGDFIGEYEDRCPSSEHSAQLAA